MLIDPEPELGGTILDHLLAEGDEVRVLVGNPSDWKARGAFVAVGDPMDPDLVERACTNVRTVVFMTATKSVPISVLAAAVPAARRAGTDRVVVCMPGGGAVTADWLDGSGAGYVILLTGKRGFLPKKSADPESVARAVSAADDLAGDPKLVVDLTDDSEWAKLGGHP